MKKKILIIQTLLIALAINAFSQNTNSGVYLTFNDYLNNKLSYAINCKTETHKIRTSDFLNESYIIVVHDGQKIKLSKDSIWGFVTCDEPLVRFQNNKQYFLADKGPIWIFYRDENQTQGKTSITVRKYYFSIKGNGMMMPLTNENVKRSFSDNRKVQDMVDAQFATTDIAEYDKTHKMYKINYLMQQIGQK